MGEPRPVGSWADALYALLLRFYPTEFREGYGPEMQAFFRKRRIEEADAQPIAGLARLSLSVLADTAKTAPAEHLDVLSRDVRHGWRALRRDRSFLLLAAGTLALGIGAAAAVFAVVSAVLLRPLPYPEPDRLVRAFTTDPRHAAWTFSEPAYLDLQEDGGALAAVAAFRSLRGSLSVDGEPEMVDGASVTPSFFPLLGIRPLVGDTFAADGGGPGTTGIVLTRRLWEGRFRSDPAVVGRPVLFDGVARTVVGVVDPPVGLLGKVEIFAPLAPDPAGSRTAREIEVIGRLRPGVSVERADADMATVARRQDVEHPASQAGWGIRLTRLQAWLLGPFVARMLWVLLGAVALFWVLAGTNVAGLVVARGTARRQEIAVRIALGASRARLVRQLVTESALVVLMGAAAGLVLAEAALVAIRHFGPALLSQLAEAHLDGWTLTLTAAMAGLSTLGFGLLPALRSGRTDVGSRLMEGGRGSSGRQSTRALLVGAQTAIAMTLLVGAGLLLRSFLALSAVDPGYDPERVLAVHLSFPESQYAPERRDQALRELPERLASVTGVVAVGATSVAPFGTWSTANRFRREDTPPGEYLSAAWRSVTPGFFRALGIPLVRGRLLGETDVDGSLEVVVITESMARRFWPDADPVGQRLLWGSSGRPKEIVGIVGDLRDTALDAEPRPTMFRPYSQLTPGAMTVLVRTAGDPTPLTSLVRREMRALMPDVPLQIEPLRSALHGSIARPRAGAWAFLSFALLALALAAAGLFGLVAYDVTRRRREIAIRMALGASAAAVSWAIQRSGLRTVGLGAALGLCGSLALSRVLASLLYQTSPTDLATHVGVGLVLVAVAATASTLAARAALRVDPVEALRSE